MFEEPAFDSPGVTLVLLPAGARVAAHPALTTRADDVVDAVSVDELSATGMRATRCPAGHYTPYSLPGREGCHRPELPLFVGRPASLVIDWDEIGARVTLPLSGDAGDVLRLRAFADPADPRLGAEDVRLRLRAEDDSTVELVLPVPEVRRIEVPPFELAIGFLPWRTTRVLIGAPLRSVTLEIVAPAAGTLQIVSLGVD